MSARRSIVSALAFLPLLAAATAAQSLPPPQAPLGLNVSLPAAKRLAGSREFIATGNWDAAIKSLELLSDDFGESLIEVEPGRFLNVRQAVTATISRLPPSGLAAYRRRVDPAMKQLFAEASARGSLELQQQVVREGFASSSGDDALDWLAETALEAGDYDRARGWWTLLLPPPSAADTPLLLRFPDAALPPADVVARLILCSILVGDRVRAAGEIEAFQTRFGDAQGELAGESGPLAATLLRLLNDSRRWRPATGSSDGDLHSTADGAIDLSVICWSQPLPQRTSAAGGRSVSWPRFPEFAPAIWTDVVVLAGDSTVRALSLEDGRSRWPSDPTDDGTIYSEPSPSLELAEAAENVETNECRIVNGRCFVRIGGQSSTTVQATPSQLICLDLNAQGRLIWSIGSDELDAQPEVRFSGPPLVSEGRVYIPVRSAAAHVEVGLACIEASTGRLLWNHRLCTAMEAAPAMSGRGAPDLLAVGAGLVFQMPAAGIIAASEAETGELRWAVTYPRSLVPSDSQGGRGGIVFHGGRLFATPRDSERVLALSAGDGRRLWSQDTSGRIADLLGVVAGRVIGCGDQLWGFDEASGQAWRFGFDDPEGYGFGRGTISGGKIYWPTREEMFVVDARSGQVVDHILFNSASGITGGNVSSASDRLIIAGTSQLTVIGPIPNR